MDYWEMCLPQVDLSWGGGVLRLLDVPMILGFLGSVLRWIISRCVKRIGFYLGAFVGHMANHAIFITEEGNTFILHSLVMIIDLDCWDYGFCLF